LQEVKLVCRVNICSLAEEAKRGVRAVKGATILEGGGDSWQSREVSCVAGFEREAAWTIETGEDGGWWGRSGQLMEVEARGISK
jgi:hypothetical protein